MEILENEWIEPDLEDVPLICGIYCKICEMEKICLSKEIFKRAAF